MWQLLALGVRRNALCNAPAFRCEGPCTSTQQLSSQFPRCVCTPSLPSGGGGPPEGRDPRQCPGDGAAPGVGRGTNHPALPLPAAPARGAETFFLKIGHPEGGWLGGSPPSLPPPRGGGRVAPLCRGFSFIFGALHQKFVLTIKLNPPPTPAAYKNLWRGVQGGPEVQPAARRPRLHRRPAGDAAAPAEDAVGEADKGHRFSHSAIPSPMFAPPPHSPKWLMAR